MIKMAACFVLGALCKERIVRGYKKVKEWTKKKIKEIKAKFSK